MPPATARTVALLLLIVAPACGARRPARTAVPAAAVERANALLREGCYTCLQQAHAIYSSVTGSPGGRRSDTAVRGTFELTLLLALREKELGLPADLSLARARALLSDLSRGSRSRETGVNADAAAMLLAAAEAFRGDRSGLDAEERQGILDLPDQHRVAEENLTRVQQVRQARSLFPQTAVYLALALDCEQPQNRQLIDAAARRAMADGSELMQYRVAICSDAPPTALASLRTMNARWTDTLFFEGKYEMGSPSRAADGERAASLLGSATGAFPESTSMWLVRANAEDLNGDFAAALASFERVLASRPTHVDARLGRLKTLSYLGRAEDGIAAATTLIDAGSWHVGEAYYWRAWNQYQTRRLEPAWADIEHAMRLWANTTVYALAGSIAYARRDLHTAVRHFDRAFEMDASNCPAATSAGLVHVELVARQQAAESYSRATSCFAVAAGTARTDLANLELSALEPERKAKRVSSTRKRIESAEELAAQAAISAAESYLHSNQARLALDHAEMAARHPSTRTQALALSGRIANTR